MKNNKNISILIATSLVFLLVVGVFFLLVLGIMGRGDRTVSLLDSIENLTKQQQDNQLFEKNIKATEADRSKVTSYIVRKDGLVEFIKVVEGMALFSGVDISIKTVVETEVTGQASSTPKVMLVLPFSTIGAWENTAKFIALLESVPYKTELTKVDLQKIDLAGNSDPKVKRFSNAYPGWKGDFEFSVLKFK